MAALFSFISVIAAWVMLYWDSFPPLLRRWNTDDYSYCWLVVPLALYVAWQRKDLLPKVITPSPGSGYLTLLLSGVLFFLGKAAAVDALVFASMWLTVVSVVLFVYGWRSMKAFFFPLLVLAFAVPPPPFINRILTFKLRLISSDISVRMMQFIDIPVFREGNVIDLGVIQLHVVDACSGLRYVFPTILLGILMGYWFNSRTWQRVLVVLSTVPTAIFANALRIAIVGYLARNVSVETAESFFHDASGVVIYVLSIIVLATWSLLLNLLASRKPEQRAVSRPGYYGVPTGRALHVFLMAAVLGIYFAGNMYLFTGRVVPQRTSFDNFPLEIGDYIGKKQFYDDKIIESLGSDDYLSGIFRDKRTGREILLMVTYYDYQEPQRAAHNPVSCLLGGGGWSVASSRDLPADPQKGRPFKVRRLLLDKPGQQLLAFYWFQQRGRVITDEYMNKVYLAVDSITQKRTDGALIRVELLLREDESVEQGQQILEDFIKNFSSRLKPYIPE
ncbi:VPLPA-CTERM-specific exosortase XrtD [Maridesulfovibrio salexigens]|uniref:Eight transmembrane protein EpsH n=1 Tax=Maridesulfovibrio salexigens (strain ATCC 14822 / DSM 2638 / NCIMB 8403 / VKM B-1763) TaxID=526222 RepID=C6BXH9_MARSD|nr:VPLPA-CTERM-specific exosortase XrtD [Maridesulfovibrio salexigens]ACS80485.1 eight transmembrane protein EpsH [Maridesulfovibrio salexigens DSM 2638]